MNSAVDDPRPIEGEALRREIYRGRVLFRAANESTLALVGQARALLEHELGLPIEMAAVRMPAEAHFAAIGRVRQQLLADRFLDLLRAILAGVGLDPPELAIDRPRLRAVLDRGHTHPAALAAYYAHRDTWYANPAAQMNFWIPLHDVRSEETFAIYPDAFAVPVANDSASFDWGVFKAVAGWQCPHAPEGTAYPRATESIARWTPLAVEGRAGDLVIFSGAHLHQTQAHAAGRTRLSLDFRAVHLGDHAQGLGAPEVDNRSRGSTLGDYVRDPRSDSE
ncbi:MAG: hypothetical protein IT384_30275 [Deltaproteobacteria bacterium]|nr:hypothetical protein [Deltaproteobacteria bacterium]